MVDFQKLKKNESTQDPLINTLLSTTLKMYFRARR